LNADGSWSFGAKNVNTNVLVEVRTEAVDKTLTTEADAGSQISAGKVYPYDPNKTEEVTFSANAGCYVATVEINGTVYDLTNAADRENLANLYKAEFVTVVNGSGETVVVSGSVEVSCSRDNHVAVISQIRSFKVYIKYFIKNADGTYTEVTALEQAPVVVQIGATVADKVTFDYAAGATVTVGETEYTLDGWFTDDAANGFVEAFSQTLTMPESDITISAVMTAVPAEDIPPKTGVTLALPMAALAMASIGGVLTLLGKKKFLGEDEE